jgi:hypothetical protein
MDLPSIRKEDVVGGFQLDGAGIVLDCLFIVLGGKRLVSESASFGG